MGTKRNPEDIVRGRRLKLAREQAGYDSAAEAVDELDLHYPTYQAHESGWRGFDRQTARKYAELYRVNVDWLDEEIGPMRGNAGHQDPLAGLSPERRREALAFIDFLKNKP